MGSSWRENLYLYGLTGMGYGLCAPLLGIGPNYILVNDPDPRLVTNYVLPFHPDETYQRVTGLKPASWPPHFPYGLRVPKDVPV